MFRERRQRLGLTLADISRATRIKESWLALIEEGRIEAFPARVYVQGFIIAYAKEVGIEQSVAIEELRRYVGRCAAQVHGVVAPGTPEARDDRSQVRLLARLALAVIAIVVVVLLAMMGTK